MSKFGQYCPVAQALEFVGDRWTLLIIRDMLTGTTHFNALMRGLPRLSRGLLSKRLQQLIDAGIVEKRNVETGRMTTEYSLTEAGLALHGVVEALMVWGADWAFGDPTPDQLDPLLLLWWMHNRVHEDRLPDERVTIQIEFTGASRDTYWLVLAGSEATICLTDPGYDLTVIIQSDVADFFQIWLGRLDYEEAVQTGVVSIEGLPRHTRAFPSWFAWSPAAQAIRRSRSSDVADVAR